MHSLRHSPFAHRWKRTLARALRLAGVGAREAARRSDDMDALRELCRGLVGDLAPEPRHALVLRILHARDRDDLWNLRSQLFGAISLQFGEHVARERLQRLDAHWA